MAKTLPPVWLPHAHNGFFGTFEGGQRIHVKLEARVSIVNIFIFLMCIQIHLIFKKY